MAGAEGPGVWLGLGSRGWRADGRVLGLGWVGFWGWGLRSGPPPSALVCPQPVGALLLEHCRITQEEPSGFSISECRDGPAATPQNKAHCPEQPHSGWPPRRRGSGSVHLSKSLSSRHPPATSTFSPDGEHCLLRAPCCHCTRPQCRVVCWGVWRVPVG